MKVAQLSIKNQRTEKLAHAPNLAAYLKML